MVLFCFLLSHYCGPGTLRDLDLVDNPLVCTCDLMWYKEWSTSLGEKEDEQMSRKRTVCTLGSSNVHQREIKLSDLPKQLVCEGEKGGRRSPNSAPSASLSGSFIALLVAAADLVCIVF
ncbi:uncharacterized protein LOC103520320 [Diaphorina citri]|uniref:Uncharacterized protein LOC103520320 n=1 Tax=Diaphorina citri TaxID=121845 RepID=A0A1S3DKA0_DIACI|nr:uncharacterized protein LOC103520320 [Diaphorina citri]